MTAESTEYKHVPEHIVHPHPDPEGSFFDTEPQTTISPELLKGVDLALRREFIEGIFNLMRPRTSEDFYSSQTPASPSTGIAQEA